MFTTAHFHVIQLASARTLSSVTGMYTVISLFVYFRKRYSPSSRFSFRAAASNRASADSYTLNSLRETSVAMATSPHSTGRCFLHPARRTHAFEPASRPENSAREPQMASIRTKTTWRKERNKETEELLSSPRQNNSYASITKNRSHKRSWVPTD